MKRCLIVLLALVFTQSSCKDRSVSHSLEASALAAGSSADLLTKNGKKKYPSQRMLQAAMKALGDALQAQAANDAVSMRKKLGLAKLNLRMRPVRKQGVAAPQAGNVTCTLAAVSSGQKAVATMAVPNDDTDEFAKTEGGIDVTGEEDGESYEENYTFDMQVVGDDLNVTVYENLRAEDEVGGFSCNVAAARGQKFCVQPLDGSNGRVGNFSCVLN